MRLSEVRNIPVIKLVHLLFKTQLIWHFGKSPKETSRSRWNLLLVYYFVKDFKNWLCLNKKNSNTFFYNRNDLDLAFDFVWIKNSLCIKYINFERIYMMRHHTSGSASYKPYLGHRCPLFVKEIYSLSLPNLKWTLSLMCSSKFTENFQKSLFKGNIKIASKKQWYCTPWKRNLPCPVPWFWNFRSHDMHF